MRRPWQIWSLYLLGLAVVLPVMGWLTVKALELDRAEALARRQSELEEDISRALWRMDSLLTPLLAEEAARPDFVYRPVYATNARLPAEGKSAEKAVNLQELSPLLAAPPQFVLLHFEVHPDGCVTSPQNPTGVTNTWALDNGASATTISAAAGRLEVMPALVRDQLLAELPEQPLPAVAIDTLSQRRDIDAGGQGAPQQPVIASNYADIAQNTAQQSAQPDGPLPANAPPPSYLFNQFQQTEAPPAQADNQQAGPSQQAGLSQNPRYGQQLSYNNSVEVGRSQRPQSRGGNDLPNREAALQAAAQRSYNEQRQNTNVVLPPTRVVEGVSRPLWLGNRLILARRVQIGEQTVIQGCWLDWEALKQRLREEVADLLPEVELTPLTAPEPIKLSRLLATIPVQLSVPMPAASPQDWSPIRVSLVAAWVCMLLAAAAAAMTLQSVITLSERRGAFVSAVTHELRTPLTTFRMYAEMLAEGMVPDVDQQQKYLNTLRSEADRLAHLVENVLQYARLERGRPGKRREQVTLASLVDHTQSRLADRAEQAEMKLVVEMSEEDAGTLIATDAAAVEQIVFNLVDNACKYAACASDKRIHLTIAKEPRRVKLTVRDHGPGIAAPGRRRLFQPFSKSVHEAANSAPGVGLGLALSRRLAQDLGGKLELVSPPDGGAAFVLTLPNTQA